MTALSIAVQSYISRKLSLEVTSNVKLDNLLIYRNKKVRIIFLDSGKILFFLGRLREKGFLMRTNCFRRVPFLNTVNKHFSRPISGLIILGKKGNQKRKTEIVRKKKYLFEKNTPIKKLILKSINYIRDLKHLVS